MNNNNIDPRTGVNRTVYNTGTGQIPQRQPNPNTRPQSGNPAVGQIQRQGTVTGMQRTAPVSGNTVQNRAVQQNQTYRNQPQASPVRRSDVPQGNPSVSAQRSSAGVNTTPVNGVATAVNIKRPQTQTISRPASASPHIQNNAPAPVRSSGQNVTNNAVRPQNRQQAAYPAGNGYPNGGSERLTPPGRLTPSNGASQPSARPNKVVRDGVTYVKKKKSGKKAFSRSSSLDSKGQVKSSTGDAVSNTLGSVFKAVAYIGFVLVISVVLSIFGISVGNDVFAFSKEESNVTVVIPEYASIMEISHILKETGIIKYPWVFQLYAKLSSMDTAEYEAGTYDVSTTMSYDALMNEFVKMPPARTQISVTIPEGYTVDQIINLFVEEYGIGSVEEFRKALEEYPWDYWFVQELEDNYDSRRKYKLEGYLFPDTYYYYSDANPTTVIWKMLENFNEKFTDDMRDRCAALGYTVDEMVTLASMIQMEARFPSEYTDISSVFHNRLNNPYNETQGRLESDPTIMYALGEHRTNLTYDEKNLDSPYNTYIVKGLPPSAISNPSLFAINCALYPNETSYLYFYALGNGYHVFASDYQQHVKNINDANSEQ